MSKYTKNFNPKEWEVVRYVTEVYHVTAPTMQQAMDHVTMLGKHLPPNKVFCGRITAKRTDYPGRERKP